MIKCLIPFQHSLVRFDLQNTITTGDAARLSVCIKNTSEKITLEMLGGVSSALRIDYRLTKSDLLPIYEEFGWIRINRTGSKIESIIEQFPPTQDILSDLGKRWREEPTPIEEASISSVNLVSARPYSKDALMAELELDEDKFQIVFDYGENAGYLGKFTSQDQEKEAIWTPHYWTSNSENVRKFIEKRDNPQFEKIGNISRYLRKVQGIPKEQVRTHIDILDAGISHGFFPSIKVSDKFGNDYVYVFSATPHFDADPKRDIFEKARQIVDCIRHGEHHAEGSRIKYPRKILYAMRNGTMRPQPYSRVQYAILVIHGIVKLAPLVNDQGFNTYSVQWIDTPENNLAANIADQLLSGLETHIEANEELEAKKVLLQGTYHYSSEQRRLKSSTQIVAAKEFARVMEQVSGVRL